jgi:hypothetical protein
MGSAWSQKPTQGMGQASMEPGDLGTVVATGNPSGITSLSSRASRISLTEHSRDRGFAYERPRASGSREPIGKARAEKPGEEANGEDGGERS